MNAPLFAVVLAGIFFLTSCSGILPSLPGGGPVVKPRELAAHSQGGSMSTLWYHGSDRKYHYFSHLFKVSTRYRIKRRDLDWTPAFPVGSREPVFASRQLARYRSGAQ